MIEQTPYIVSKDLILRAYEALPEIEFKLSLNHPTGDFFYDPWTLKEEFKNTVWEEIINSLPEENKGEARIINLDIKTCYTKHSDIDDRWHLSLSKGDGFLVDLESNIMHQTHLGHWYSMNAGLLHSAVNFGDECRYQLVIRKLLTRNILQHPINVLLSIKDPPHNYRFIIDQHLSPKLNTWNKQKTLSNFKQNKDNTISFTIEENKLKELENVLSCMDLQVEVSYDSI